MEGPRDIATLRGDEAPEVEALVLADGEPAREPDLSTCSFSAGVGDAGTLPGSVGSCPVHGLLPGSRAPALPGDLPPGVPQVAVGGPRTREPPCLQGPAGQCRNGLTMLLQAFISPMAFGRT